MKNQPRALLLCSVLLPFCGVTAEAAAPISTPTPLPANYAAKLQSRAVWDNFPLTVRFIHDQYYTAAREQAARQGFAMWTQATQGRITFQVVGEDAQAGITVRFSLANNDGFTTTSWTDERIEAAQIRLGARRGSLGDVRCLAAHEFGHALGLDGHSGDERDIMFPVHHIGRACRITARDLNTLTVLYPALSTPN